jgi:hypothetical protein
VLIPVADPLAASGGANAQAFGGVRWSIDDRSSILHRPAVDHCDDPDSNEGISP